jgi:hypothetical protein
MIEKLIIDDALTGLQKNLSLDGTHSDCGGAWMT